MREELLERAHETAPFRRTKPPAPSANVGREDVDRGANEAALVRQFAIDEARSRGRVPLSSIRSELPRLKIAS